MERLIEQDKSVIVACDVETLTELEKLVNETCFVPGIGGYKFGFELVDNYTLKGVMNTISERTELPGIYDKQKGGTDIPKLGERFARNSAKAKVDAVILFPFGGRVTEVEWIKACQKENLTVLLGLDMTQEGFLVSDGGFVADDAPERAFKIAIENGVCDFVVPGNRPASVRKYRQQFVDGLGEDNFTLYAPGFIGQGGVITETGKVAGKNWHAIVGSAIYKADDMETAAREVTSQIYK